MYWHLFTLLIVSLGVVVDCFNPNQVIGMAASSRTHKDITEKAVRDTAKIYMDQHPDDYPDQDMAMATGDFKQAITHFKTGAAKPDLEPNLKDLPLAHFDNEEVVQSNQRLLTERLKVLSALNNDDMAGARDLTGQLLHTLQDFYSHTNWVELDKVGVNDALGDPGKANVGTFASPDLATCSDCQEKT